METIQHSLLESILNTMPSGSGGINAQKFRAQHHDHLNALDDLEKQHYIENTDGNYIIKLPTLRELDKQGSKANHIIFLCELIFKTLRRFYLNHTGETISLNALAIEAGITRADVNSVFSYFTQSSLLSQRTTNFESETAIVTPSEEILRYKSFNEVIDQHIKMRRPSIQPAISYETEPTLNQFKSKSYINQERITDIENLKSTKFDFSRLIQICKEINYNARNENYLAVGALTRMLLDHIPPIFGHDTFKAASANYKSGKSLKKSLQHLENVSRDIFDRILHSTIRKTESLPTSHQVDFSASIDLLLEEIIRIIKEQSK